MDLRLYITALQCGVKKPGLSLSDFRVDIWRVKKQWAVPTISTTPVDSDGQPAKQIPLSVRAHASFGTCTLSCQ